jgi:hypothetical protein
MRGAKDPVAVQPNDLKAPASLHSHSVASGSFAHRSYQPFALDDAYPYTHSLREAACATAIALAHCGWQRHGQDRKNVIARLLNLHNM